MTAQATFRLISAKEFIRTTTSGKPDLEESKRVLVELAEILEPPADYDILVDCREAHGTLTYADIYELAMELCRHPSAFRNKVAVLTRSDSQWDKASLFEVFARGRGYNVAAFTDFEEVIEWLSEGRYISPGEQE